MDTMLSAMKEELRIRGTYLGGDVLNSIYFGGGTPSVVEASFIAQLIQDIQAQYQVSPQAEITLEANPDDLDVAKLTFYKEIGINRLSIGIQSFDNAVLSYLNRAHDKESALSCIKKAQDVGFDNISLDLMYGIPNTSATYWEHQLEVFERLKVPHLSAYCMTIEPRTVFGNFLKNKKMKPADEEAAASQFEYLMNFCDRTGFEQYEVSNFCKPGKYAVHNSGYWRNSKYLGIGPGAHSYNRVTREYNISNNPIYIRNVTNGDVFSETELLTKENLFDEYIMTSLRTKWGCNIETLKSNFQYDISDKPFFIDFVKKGLIIKNEDVITLSKAGTLIADNIILEFIYNGL